MTRSDAVSDVRFMCPECFQKLVIDAAAEGLCVACPHCGGRIIVPGAEEDEIEVKLTSAEIAFLTAPEAVRPPDRPAN